MLSQSTRALFAKSVEMTKPLSGGVCRLRFTSDRGIHFPHSLAHCVTGVRVRLAVSLSVSLGGGGGVYLSAGEAMAVVH